MGCVGLGDDITQTSLQCSHPMIRVVWHHSVIGFCVFKMNFLCSGDFNASQGFGSCLNNTRAQSLCELCRFLFLAQSISPFPFISFKFRRQYFLGANRYPFICIKKRIYAHIWCSVDSEIEQKKKSRFALGFPSIQFMFVGWPSTNELLLFMRYELMQLNIRRNGVGPILID